VVPRRLRADDPAPATLREAHEVLHRQRPKLADEPAAWIAFHRHGAEVYAAVAKVDTDHQHEAQVLAGREIRRAREIEDRLTNR
jgi:hypothetical protein